MNGKLPVSALSCEDELQHPCAHRLAVRWDKFEGDGLMAEKIGKVSPHNGNLANSVTFNFKGRMR
jgi:hypothetical protein